MAKKYGLYLDDTLMITYDDPKKALEAAIFAEEETGMFHEVKEVKE